MIHDLIIGQSYPFDFEMREREGGREDEIEHFKKQPGEIKSEVTKFKNDNKRNVPNNNPLCQRLNEILCELKKKIKLLELFFNTCPTISSYFQKMIKLFVYTTLISLQD